MKVAAVEISVLVVEDDKTTALVAKAICESLGCAAHIASNGVEAIQLFEEQAFHLVILDLQMPVMGGFETAYEIRELEEEEQRVAVPIVAVTGTVSPDNRMRCLSAGMNDCVAKPYTVRMMGEVLQRFVPDFVMPDEVPVKTGGGQAGGTAI